MGREWYWGGGKASKGGRGAGSGSRSHDIDSTASASAGCMCAMFQLFDFHQLPSFDSIHPSFLPNQEDPPPPISKGTEAPRNSLELDEPNPLTMSAMKEDESLIIPIGRRIQIRTNNKDGKRDCSSSSEISSSPGTKTPNLVARLMGLDLLPDNASCSSPTASNVSLDTPNLQGSSSSRSSYYQHRPKPARDSSRSSSCLDKKAGGTRSLPETPRVSSSRRSVDTEHRFSLQFNKENVSASDEMMLSRVSSLIRKRENEEVSGGSSRSPGHYARQIVKQVKESVVGRKVGFGVDITNTVNNRNEDRIATANYPNEFKSKKISKVLTKRVDVSSSSTTSQSQSQSCSPRIKFLDSKNKPTQTQNVVPPQPATTTKDHSICHKSSPRLQLSSVPNSHVNIAQLPQSSKPGSVSSEQDNKCHHQKQNRPVSSKKCSSTKMAAAEEGRIGPFVAPRLKKPPQTSEIIRIKEEPTGKNCKKKSNDHTTVQLLPVKKDPTPPATKIPQKQAVGASNYAQESKRCTQLSSCTSQSYYKKQQIDTTHLLYNRENDRSNGCATTAAARGGGGGGGESAEAEYRDYITRVLKRTGINRDTHVSSSCIVNPLDPAIFNYLELFYYPNGRLQRRCNRKLLFQLVDEILAQMVRKHGSFSMNGSHLVNVLCEKVRSFPSADCRVLEDIDGLIDGDLPSLIKVEDEEGFEEEIEEGVMRRMEEEILDGLLHETAAVFRHERS